jgi:hypothetical protein
MRCDCPAAKCRPAHGGTGLARTLVPPSNSLCKNRVAASEQTAARSARTVQLLSYPSAPNLAAGHTQWSIVVATNRRRSTLNRRGQALSEYAMLVAMVGMGLVVILGLFGRATKHVWQSNESQFASGDPSVASAPSPAPAGGGGTVSGSAHPTPAPSTGPASPPRRDSSDSSSADSLGGASANAPADLPPGSGEDPSLAPQ